MSRRERVRYRDKDRDKDRDKEKLPPHWQRVQGAIWLIGLAILFSYGKIFPGILVLVAISGLAQAGIMAYVSRQQESETLATTREERLPENCPNCGGPLNAASVRWMGKQIAICPYCGSTVKNDGKNRSMSYHRFLPLDLHPEGLSVVIGLVSDTHMPLRRRYLPTNLGDLFGGVDFLLHAGDVGELWVLDQLSEIAPVIAVHGNDDTDDAQRELPFQQLVTVSGQRILLWHSHFPDLTEEMEFRKDDDLYRSIQRSVDQAKRAGAKIVVFGHWHIPLVYRTNDVLIINPGALASGNEFSRMLRNTVALLFIEKSGAAHVVHVDLAAPNSPYTPQIEWDAGFMVAMNQFSKSIVAPDLAPAFSFLRANLAREELLAIRPLVAALALPIWERNEGLLTVADVDDAFVNAKDVPPELHEHVLTLWRRWLNSRTSVPLMPES